MDALRYNGKALAMAILWMLLRGDCKAPISLDALHYNGKAPVFLQGRCLDPVFLDSSRR